MFDRKSAVGVASGEQGGGRIGVRLGGVAGGAAIGANVNRPDAPNVDTRDVRRCETAAPAGPPQFYDVTYNYRGVEHRVQMATQPGRTITVNAEGEPRG